MVRSNFGAVRLPLLAAAVLASFAVDATAQVVEKGRTFADLTASHPCASGLTERIARVTDCDAADDVGDGEGLFQCWVRCDGTAPWETVAIGGGAGGGAATAVTGSATLPATCAEKDLYQDTDSGGTELYVCTATNTWTKAGDVAGPASSTDNAITRFDSTTGKLLQDSAITVADTTGNLQWEGTTADDFEGNFTFADPTADWTWTWSASGQVLAPLGSESLPAYSFAGSVDTGFYGTASTIYATVSSTSKLRINANGTSILHGWLYGSGDPNNRLFGFAKWVSASTAGSGAPEAADPVFGMAVYTNEGTTAQNYRTLPSAAAGYEFTFVVQDADGIRVVAAAGDTIRIAGTASATAGYAQSTTIGSALTLVAINATEWVAISSLGTWTIDS